MMAENDDRRGGPATWAVAGVAAAALACISLVSVGLVLVLRQGGPATVNANPVINIHPSPAPAGIVRSSPPAPSQAQAVRAVAQEPAQGQAGLPTPATRVPLRVREQVFAAGTGKAPLPMPPVRYRADTQGRVEGVFASRQDANAPAAPDRSYADTGASGAQMELQLLQPRSTQALKGYRAPQGFSFFTGRVQLRSRAAQSLALDLGAFEVRDSDGAAYLANPELSAPLPAELAPGQTAEAELSFLVSDQAGLSALVLQAAGAPLQLPLARR
jgi:hypothetical protein